MQVRTPSELAALVRERRRQLGLTQAELARRCGTSPRWMVSFEAGKPSVQLGMVLHVLASLGMALDTMVTSDEPGSRLDSHLEQFTRGR